MKAEDLYHVGIVVDDLDSTLRSLTDVAGYQWCDRYEGDQVVETQQGELTLPLRFAYSMSEPRLEILQSLPGTLWMPASSGIHHLGYWSEAVDDDLATLVAAGHEVEARAPLPDGSTLWAYCRSGSGPRTELVSALIRPVMEQWFESGRMPGADEVDIRDLPV